jgi:hypothetical protein
MLWNLAVTTEQSSLLCQAVTMSVDWAVSPGHRILGWQGSHGHSS